MFIIQTLYIHILICVHSPPTNFNILIIRCCLALVHLVWQVFQQLFPVNSRQWCKFKFVFYHKLNIKCDSTASNCVNQLFHYGVTNYKSFFAPVTCLCSTCQILYESISNSQQQMQFIRNDMVRININQFLSYIAWLRRWKVSFPHYLALSCCI